MSKFSAPDEIVRIANLHFSKTGDKNKIVGTARGFHTIIDIRPGNYTIIVTIAVKEGQAPSIPIDRLPVELRYRNPDIEAINYQGKELVYSVKGRSMRQVTEKGIDVMEDVWDYLGRNGFVTCCSYCGSEEYDINAYRNKKKGSMHYLCYDCLREIREAGDRRRREEWEKEIAVAPNIPMGLFLGILGTILGTVISVILLYCFYHRFTYWISCVSVAIAGGVMLGLAVRGYKAGSHRKPGLLWIIFWSVLCLFFGYLSYHLYVLAYIRSSVGDMSFMETVRCMQLLLSKDPAIQNALQTDKFRSFYVEGMVRNSICFILGVVLKASSIHVDNMDPWEMSEM